MTKPGPTRRGRDLETRVRLVSGVVLFAFTSTHLLNHALGIASLGLMEQGRHVFLAFWRAPVVDGLLGAAFVAHLLLGIWHVLVTPAAGAPRWQRAQRVTGLLVPVLLLPHMASTLLAHEIFGVDDTYAFELLRIWPEQILFMAATVVVAWVHGCVGMHFWLRLREGYRRAAPSLLGVAVALPLLALVGAANGGREVRALAADPDWLASAAASGGWNTPEAEAFLASAPVFGVVSALVIVCLLAARTVARRVGARACITITYPDGRTVSVPRNTTVLDASHAGGVPHASVCGGRGRCSTCRIRIEAGLDQLPPPGERERALLERVGVPPNVRLACQVRPGNDVAVTPLLPPHVEPRAALRDRPFRYGSELEVAVLFSDLRGFTTMTEHRLAFDVVFVLNRYFRAMGETIVAGGGHLVQVFGDGTMALFVGPEGASSACRQALRTSRAMFTRLDELNAELGEPLRMGIGLHVGSAIVGEMGYQEATILTAVGEPVNTASRLQEATKDLNCELVVSCDLAERGDVDLAGFPEHELPIRGLTRPLRVIAVERATGLPELASESLTSLASPGSPGR